MHPLRQYLRRISLWNSISQRREMLSNDIHDQLRCDESGDEQDPLTPSSSIGQGVDMALRDVADIDLASLASDIVQNTDR